MIKKESIEKETFIKKKVWKLQGRAPFCENRITKVDKIPLLVFGLILNGFDRHNYANYLLLY